MGIILNKKDESELVKTEVGKIELEPKVLETFEQNDIQDSEVSYKEIAIAIIIIIVLVLIIWLVMR